MPAGLRLPDDEADEADDVVFESLTVDLNHAFLGSADSAEKVASVSRG